MAGEHWQGFTKEIDQDQAAARFKRKFGYPPVKVLDAKTAWLCGPIGERPKAETCLPVLLDGEQLELGL